MRTLCGMTAAVGLLAGACAGASDAGVGWRGDGSGCYPTAQPPLGWGPASNVLWKTPLPGWSNASPVPLNDRVFVCVEPATLVCLSLADGKILWQHEQHYADVAATPAEAEQARSAAKALDAIEDRLRSAEQAVRKARDAAKKQPGDAALKQAVEEAAAARDAVEREAAPYAAWRLPATHNVCGHSTPTPVTDGARVYALFGIGTLAAYTPDGARLWARTVGRPKHNWGHSASPVLSGDTLLVLMGDRLSALDAATGAERWQAASASGWGTPAVTAVGGRRIVITPSGDWFDVADGTPLGTGVQKFAWNGPVVDGGVVYQMDENGASAVALTAEGTPQPAWQAKVAKQRYYATSLVHNGLLYNVHQAGHLSVLDTASGALVYERDIAFSRGGKTVYPSPVLAGGRLYLSTDTGETVVIAPGREYRELARSTLEPFRSTPACAGRRMLVRTLTALYCLEEPAPVQP